MVQYIGAKTISG